MSLVSCVTIRNNYLGPTNCEQEVFNQRMLSDSEKRQNLLKTDQLLQVVSEQRKQSMHFKAQLINQLYTDFGGQLNEDRKYQCLLNRQPINKDTLSAGQYLATIELLSSAANYEQYYQRNRFIRRNMNRGDSGNNIPKLILQKSRNFLFAPSVRKRLETQPVNLKTYLTDSLYRQLPKTNTFKATFHRVYRNNDRLHAFLYNSAYIGSYCFGNLIGIFHSNSDPMKNASDLQPFLNPFDLVLMRSPNHLTNKFIPGYFGHVGIWLGNNMVERYLVKPFEKHRKNGAEVVEVLRSGVQISTLDEFADGETFLVIRPDRLSGKQKRTILANIRKQLAKAYDFNFDVESPEAITCTELVYLSYDFVDWKIRYTMQRCTISPDDLVFTALKDKNFNFPVYLEKGRATINPDSTFVRSLVGNTGH